MGVGGEGARDFNREKQVMSTEGFRGLWGLRIVECTNPDIPISDLKVPFLPTQSLDLGISDLPGMLNYWELCYFCS